MRGVVWFRRDLRLADQPALTAACEACREVMPLFVFDEPLLKAQVFGSASLNFMLGCLDELASAMAGSVMQLEHTWNTATSSNAPARKSTARNCRSAVRSR